MTTVEIILELLERMIRHYPEKKKAAMQEHIEALLQLEEVKP